MNEGNKIILWNLTYARRLQIVRRNCFMLFFCSFNRTNKVHNTAQNRRTKANYLKQTTNNVVLCTMASAAIWKGNSNINKSKHNLMLVNRRADTKNRKEEEIRCWFKKCKRWNHCLRVLFSIVRLKNRTSSTQDDERQDKQKTLHAYRISRDWWKNWMGTIAVTLKHSVVFHYTLF